jgi:tRNA threonylcarbamoyl adenosine modification protein (Sua5/YciO/YrdC/YwlC family)
MTPELDEALARIGRGELVAYPTETLYGLGADARSEAAVGRLRGWKGREPDAPLSILVEDAAALEGLGLSLPAPARRLAEALWPGPLTLVLRACGGFADGVARREDGAVGVRCSSHPVAAGLAQRLARAGAGPITATSLNRSGFPPVGDRDEARALCGEPGAPWLLDPPDAPEPGGDASTVVDATGPAPRVLREGAVGSARIAACWAGEGAA